MQLRQAAELQKQWARNHPDEQCQHPHLDRLYHLGAQDIDDACTTCGETFSPDEVRKLREQQLGGFCISPQKGALRCLARYWASQNL